VRIIHKDKVIYTFSPDHPFAYEVDDGEEFLLETDDCYGGKIKTEKDLRPMLDESKLDAAVGPIRVKGARKGDVLCVEVLDIMLADQGVMMTNCGLGTLGERITEPNTKVIKIKEGKAFFSEDLLLPLTPMVGVIGVLPEKGIFPATVPGDFGGNMDTKEVKVGTKVFLPVFIDGAGLAVADLHACMGDGELSGTGIETAGTVRLKVKVLKGLKINAPVLETLDHIYLISTAKTFEDAIKAACTRMTDLLSKKLDMSFPDSYRLMSAVCDIGISQVVNGVYTLKIRVPKTLTGPFDICHR